MAAAARLRRLAFDGAPPTAAATSPAAALPERLGDFVLGRRLGAGGMGVVHRARQESLQRDVALKLVRPEHLFFPGARERFAREVAAVAPLAHPGIVPIHASGEERGVPYFAMELVAGGTLAEAQERLRARGGRPDGAALRAVIEELAARQGERGGASSGAAMGSAADSSTAERTLAGPWIGCVLRLVRDVARALDHVHSRGVLHRDVKPSNLLLDTRGQVRLIDFGLASASGTSRLTQSGAQLDSLPWMAPEQLRGEPLDARSDVYSLGVTLWELLALRLPWGDGDAARTREQVLAGAAPPLRDHVPGLPWDVETACLTAMERDPARRYASAADFARDLDHLLALEPIEARRPGAALRVRRWVERHPTHSVALLLGFLLVVVGPSVAFLAVARERDAYRRAATTAQRTAGFLQRLFASSDPYATLDPELPVRAVLDRARADLAADLATEPEVRARLAQSLGDAYLQLGQHEAATALLGEALALQRAGHAAGPFSVASSLASLGRAALLRGDLATARAHLEEAATLAGTSEPSATREPSAATTPSADDWALARDARWLVRLEGARGDVAYAGGDPAAAERHYRAALHHAEQAGAESEWPARVWVSLSTALIDLERGDEARTGIEAALARARRLHPDGSLVEIELLANRGYLLQVAGQIDEVVTTLREAVARCRPLVAAGHPTLVSLLGNLGSLEATRGHPADAIEPLREALAAMAGSAGEDDPVRIGWSWQLLGALRDAQGDGAAAGLAVELLPALERAGAEYATWAAECRRIATLSPTPPRDG